MFRFLPWSYKLWSFNLVNMSLKHPQIWLNSCHSNSSSRSHWRSTKTLWFVLAIWRIVVKSLLRESQRTSVWKSKTIWPLPRSSQSDSKRRWFRARPLIHLMVFTEIPRTFFNFGGKVFDAKAWPWRKEWVHFQCGM